MKVAELSGNTIYRVCQRITERIGKLFFAHARTFRALRRAATR